MQHPIDNHKLLTMAFSRWFDGYTATLNEAANYDLGKNYLEKLVDACAERQVTDIDKILSYYQRFMAGKSTANLSPDALAEQIANSVKASQQPAAPKPEYEVNDDYMNAYMDEMNKFAEKTNSVRVQPQIDDFIIDFYMRETRNMTKTIVSPGELARKAIKEFPRSQFYAEKPLSIDDLTALQAQSDATTTSKLGTDDKVLAGNERKNYVTYTLKTPDVMSSEEASRICSMLENGFYYTYPQPERRCVGQGYKFVGNTDWSVEAAKEGRPGRGEDVIVYFTDGRVKDQWCDLMWDRRTLTDHVRGGDEKAKHGAGSESKVYIGNEKIPLLKTRRGIEQYRRENGELVGVLENDTELAENVKKAIAYWRKRLYEDYGG